MPLRYDPDTGIPSYFPDLGEELEEGKTPEAKVISTKSDVFKGDKKPTAEEYEALRDGDKPTIEPVEPGPYVHPDQREVADTGEADKMMEAIRNARPAKLDKDIATDEEVAAIEAAAKEHDIEHWALLLRLINRLRKAEGS